MGSDTRGTLVLDDSLLLHPQHQRSDGDPPYLLPAAADLLLRRLRYSNLHIGICYPEGDTSHKASLFKEVADKYLFDCIPLHGTLIDDAIETFLLSRNFKGPYIYATSRRDEGLFLKLLSRGWKVILKCSDVVSTLENMRLLFINQLEEIFFTLHQLIKMEYSHVPTVSVGYIMKPSREHDFAKRGAFPLQPTPNGLMFVPLSFELPLSLQMQAVDVVLHKATDEIIDINPVLSTHCQNGITYSRGMQQIERYFKENPDHCIIDPLNNLTPILDRLKIQELLVELESLNQETGYKVRGPHFLKIDTYRDDNLEDKLFQAKLSYPNIVKPQVACGVADAHSMALVFKVEHYRDLLVPLPAVIQEYVDHGSILYKFYVLGKRVFYAIKKSMPNADVLCQSSEKIGSLPILFDSLKSLPAADIDIETSKKSLDMNLAEDAANWLRGKLNLTIFGFDILVQEGSGDHIIVDVNYLPSFKEIPDVEAIPAFWDAIKSSYEMKKEKNM